MEVRRRRVSRTTSGHCEVGGCGLSQQVSLRNAALGHRRFHVGKRPVGVQPRRCPRAGATPLLLLPSTAFRRHREPRRSAVQTGDSAQVQCRPAPRGTLPPGDRQPVRWPRARSERRWPGGWPQARGRPARPCLAGWGGQGRGSCGRTWVRSLAPLLQLAVPQFPCPGERGVWTGPCHGGCGEPVCKASQQSPRVTANLTGARCGKWPGACTDISSCKRRVLVTRCPKTDEKLP